VIGRQHQQYRVLTVASRLHGRQRNRRRRIAPLGLKQNGRTFNLNLSQLLGGHKTVFVIADQNRWLAVQAGKARQRRLQHGFITVQLQKLLGA
jgi:hypothetical protein